MIDFRDVHCTLTYPVITMGTFDGVHRGHCKLLEECVRVARKAGGQAVVLTYNHHPLETLSETTRPYLITERRRKEELLRNIGIDCILYLQFTREMALMPPLAFLTDVLTGRLGMREIVVGYDTHFGHDRQGNVEFLRKHEETFGYRTHYIEAFRLNDEIVSSRRIREYVRAGDVESAAAFLGRPYSLQGLVVKGSSIGSTLGFPTVNTFPVDEYKLLPATGVYLTRAIWKGGSRWGVTNVGFSPTIKPMDRLEVETHLLDFSEDLYGREMEVVFLRRLREEKTFADRQALIMAIRDDVRHARELTPTIAWSEDWTPCD